MDGMLGDKGKDMWVWSCEIPAITAAAATVPVVVSWLVGIMAGRGERKELVIHSRVIFHFFVLLWHPRYPLLLLSLPITFFSYHTIHHTYHSPSLSTTFKFLLR